MKDKKNIILLLICAVLCVGLIAYGVISNKESNPMDNYITSAIVAKDISLIFHSQEEIDNDSETYMDKNVDEWYVPYVNMMYKDEFFNKNDIKPTPAGIGEYFTYGKLDQLFTNMGVGDKELLAYVNNNKSSGKITLSAWGEMYETIISKLDKNNNVKRVQTIIVGTPSNDETIRAWNTKTSTGEYTFSGLALDYYIDKEVVAYVRDEQMLMVTKVISNEVTYNNAWVITIDAGKIKAYIEGVVREFTITSKTTSYSNVVADIKVKKGKLDDFTIKKEVVLGKVLSSSNDGIELERSGYYKLSKNAKIYQTFGNLSMLKVSDILVGYDIGQYFIENGEIVAVVVDRDVDAKNIRVLIMNTGYNSIYHDNVKFTAENGLIVEAENNTIEIAPDEEFSLDINSSLLQEGRVKISAKGIDGKVTINSINRGYGAPAYRGDIEANIYDGKIVIVNELPVEKYLLNVVPSEMPYTYNIEALKAQAICARSYAYKQILGNGYSRFGAHVDDSTNYQVYNNASEQESTTQAVEETYGKVITYNDEVITAYFFSTSCGSTTDSAVWGSVVPYTQSILLTAGDNKIDLSKEENFDSFIRVSYDSFDSEYPWYRWNVALSLEELTNVVNSYIGSVSESSPQNVFVQTGDKKFKNEYVSNIGNVKKIEVLKRGKGGVLEEILIYGSDKNVKITKELNIRKVLNVNGYTIKRLNGQDVDSFGLLPSAYAIFDPIITDNLITGYNIIGGGYGHGVGMSQNGANYLGKNGSNVEEILKFFYKDIEIKKMY